MRHEQLGAINTCFVEDHQFEHWNLRNKKKTKKLFFLIFDEITSEKYF